MSRQLLICDDEEDIREVVQLTLEMVGDWEVTTIDSGTKAVDTAAALRPSVILLDFMMPVMDGPATFASLQADERTRDIPVIFFTAKVQTAEQRQLAALGARGLIPKPFDPMTLSDRISDLLAAPA